ncbi:MAG: cytochrome P450 [Acidobacteria bacterium]|nr:cytochrome P450 [Acidobacteriota bacterium]
MATSVLPPGPRRKPLVGNLFDFRRNPPEFLLNAANQYGEVVYLKLGPQNVFLVNDPELIKDILVTHHKNFIKSRGLQMAKRFLGEGMLTSEGEFHRRQRRLAQPAFHRQRIAAYAAVMVNYAAKMGDGWRDGETLNMAEAMMRLTLSIVGKTLFDAEVETEASEIGEALTAIMKTFDRITNPFAAIIAKLPLPSNAKMKKAHQRLDATIYRIINERRRNHVDRGDLLSMLLLAQDEEGDGSSMTDKQVRDESLTLFLAGHETTANALTWTWYLLSQNPEVEARLHDEIDHVLQGRLPNFEDVMRLPYTEQVFAEAMRLYPPAWTLGRQVLEDYRLGEFVAPKGAIILMSQYVMHHTAKYYPEPFKFDPERWTPEAREARPKFTYFPFGGGPRVCIGESFAWMEGALVLATLAQNWRMRLADGQIVKPQPLVTLRPKFGMRMKMEKRTGNQTPPSSVEILNISCGESAAVL